MQNGVKSKKGFCKFREELPKAKLKKGFIDGLGVAPEGETLFYWDTEIDGLGLKVTSKKKKFWLNPM